MRDHDRWEVVEGMMARQRRKAHRRRGRSRVSDIWRGGSSVAQSHNGGERVSTGNGLSGLTGGGHGVVQFVEHSGGASQEDGKIGDLALKFLAMGGKDLLSSRNVGSLLDLIRDLRDRGDGAHMGERNRRELGGRRGGGIQKS